VSSNPIVTLRRHKDFRRLWSSAMVSDLGTWMQAVTVTVLVANNSKSSGATALVFSSLFIPQGLMSPIGGLVADRFDRRRVAMVMQWVQAVLAGGLALTVHAGVTSAYALSAIVFLQGCASSLGNPAFQAMIPLLVPREELLGALSLSGMTWNSGRAIGPMLAAITTSLWGPAASITGNAISFVAMAFVMMTIRRPLHGGGTVRMSQAFSEIRGAMKLAGRTPGTRTMIISTIFVQLCCAMTFSTIPTYAASVTDWKKFWMVLYVSMGIGALAAGFCVAGVTALIGRSRVLTIVPSISCLAILLASQAHSPYLAVIATMLFGMSAPISFITMGAVVQRDAPEHSRGRVLSIYSALVGLAFGGFSIINGYLADKVFGLRTTLWLSSLVLALYVITVQFLWPSWRRIVNGTDSPPRWRPEALERLGR